MKSNSISHAGIVARAIVALAASSSAFGLFALEPGRPDPRTRTFVPPARVVWQAPGNGGQGTGPSADQSKKGGDDVVDADFTMK